MEEKVLKLKLLSIAYQSALEYDYCPESEKANEIKEDYHFASKYSISDIEQSLNEYSGKRPDEIANKIMPLIDCL